MRPTPSSPTKSETGDASLDDRNTRARLRDVALIRFGRDGIAATSLRSIARDAGVAPSHVVHYFSSKAGLRSACDEYVAAVLHQAQETVSDDGVVVMDALTSARRKLADTPALQYLSRSLVEPSSDASSALVDRLVADGVRYLERLEQAGVVQPSADRRSRAILLTFMTLGQLALHEHFARLTGVDVTASGDDSPEHETMAAATLGLLGTGLLTPTSLQEFEHALGASSRPSEDASC